MDPDQTIETTDTEPGDDTEPDERETERICLSDLHGRRYSDAGGIKCPDCGGTWFQVVRTTRKADKIVRRRACRRCERLILTTERLTG